MSEKEGERKSASEKGRERVMGKKSEGEGERVRGGEWEGERRQLEGGRRERVRERVGVFGKGSQMGGRGRES